MSLTVSKLEKRVIRRLGYKAMPVELPILDVANEAGEWIAGLHEWNWLLREPIPIDLTADQEYVNLPPSVGQVLAAWGQTGVDYALQLVTMQEIARLRRGNEPGGYAYKGALISPLTDVTSEPAQPRLEIWPRPSSSVTGAFLLLYRARWMRLASAADHVQVPSWLELPFVETCVAMAAGAEHEAEGTVIERLAAVTEVLYESAKRYDGTQQADYGPIEGGAGAQQYVSMRTYGTTSDPERA